MADTHSDSKAEKAPSTFKSWLAVFSVALGAFAAVTSEFTPIGLLTDIADSLNVSDGTAGLMITIPGLVAAVAAPVIMILSGRLDRRILVIGLVVLVGLANFSAALAPNFGVMLAGRVLFGIGLGGFWTVAVTLGARLVEKKSMARATTIIFAGVSIATVLGVPAGTLIAGFAGWRLTFAVIGGLSLLVGVVQLFVLPSIPAAGAPGVRQITQLFRNADTRLGLMTVAFMVAGHFAAYTYVTPFLKDGTAITPAFLSALLLAYGIAGIVGNFAGGMAAGRNLRATLVGVVVLLAGAVLLLPVVRASAAGVAVMLVVWGLAFGALPIVLQLWVFKAAPDALEGGSAMLVSTFQIFIALGSVVGGHIVDRHGTSAVMLIGGATALAALGTVALSRHVQKPEPGRAQPHMI